MRIFDRAYKLNCKRVALALTLCFAAPSAAPQSLNGREIQIAAQPGTQALAQSGPRPPELHVTRPLTRPEARARAAALRNLGARLFADPRLSASGRLACATCHDPAHAYSPANPLPVQYGGADSRQQGARATPTLTYLQAIPAFTAHFHDSEDEADESVDNGPTGGLTWDGRVDSAAAQAIIPLLSPDEMANTTAAEVVTRAASYLPDLRQILGPDAVSTPDLAFAGLRKALETFQQDPAQFYPYDSKYDAVLAGRASLTAAEARGLAAFDDPARGNCASCHISQRGRDGSPPQFTDYGFIALGVPRNRDLAPNQDPAFFDLGLCGPYRTDLTAHPEYCGLFRTPSLRNVALKQAFFHNGVIHALREAVAFYATRDTDPGHWYPRRPDGAVDKFDDLPEAYRANLNAEIPFDGRQPGGPPGLTEAEIDDITAFLQTLTDAKFTAAPR
jgi:cytochrome c peroxidase